MAENTNLAELLLRIDAQRKRAEHARRLASNIENEAAQTNMLAYAKEIEAEIEKLGASGRHETGEG